ncbi:MAG: IPExxxVDY family protein [Flavobacteriales bacterium]|jgi:hypothetical protein|nr:IPExxxVDY family protein [Flavobacteriales bacterium]MDP4954190.1 IPExxxVDY family protein [Flavobacteriales bacterium]
MKHHLSVELEFDFLLFGLSCHEKEYRLAWFINRALGLLFSCEDDLKVQQKSGESSHAFYRHVDEENELQFVLLQNRTTEGWLLPEFKEIDYFIKVEAETGFDEIEFMQELKKIPVVNACFKFNPSELKHKENLIFD